MSYTRQRLAKLVASCATASLVFTGLVGSAYAGESANDTEFKESPVLAKNLSKTPDRGVIVTVLQQNWNSIAKECAATYVPEGVKYVQVSLKTTSGVKNGGPATSPLAIS